MPDLHLRERLPELKLPEMSRDDIAKALGETRKELGEVRKDLNEYRREVEVPRMDLSKIELPNIDIGKEIRDARKDLKDAGKYMAKNARSAAQDAGLVKRPSRLPFVIAGAITIGLVGWALANSPSIKARLQLAAKQMQEKMAARRAEWEDDEPHAFDAAVPGSCPAVRLRRRDERHGQPVRGATERHARRLRQDERQADERDHERRAGPHLIHVSPPRASRTDTAPASGAVSPCPGCHPS